MTSSFSKELVKQWNSLTLKKFIICTIILLCFIMLVKVTFKDHVLEAFTTTRTIDDLALVKYEFVKYDDDITRTDGHSADSATIEKRIVWDNRIYMLQPSKAGERRYSFWNINNDTIMDFDSSKRPIKSIGTSINTNNNEAPPIKQVPVVTAGKFKPIEKYEKIAEVGSDEFSDLHLNYNTIRDTSLEKLLKVQTNIRKRLRALEKLRQYYNDVTKPNSIYIRQQLDKFIAQILEQYKVTPIGFNNPKGKIGWDTFSLAAVNGTNGVRSMTDLSKGGVGEIIAIEGVPFGSILTLSKTAALANPVVFREPYETNHVYKDKIFKQMTGPMEVPAATGTTRCPTLKEVLSVRGNQRSTVFGTTGCPSATDLTKYNVFDFKHLKPTNWGQKTTAEIRTAINSHPVDTTSKQFYMWLNDYSKNSQLDTIYADVRTNTSKLDSETVMYGAHFYKKKTRNVGGGTLDYLKRNIRIGDGDFNNEYNLNTTDLSNILTPESFYLNLVGENMKYKFEKEGKNDWGQKRTNTRIKTVVFPPKTGDEYNNAGFMEHGIHTNTRINNTLITSLRTSPSNIAISTMMDTGHLKDKGIRQMNTYKNQGDNVRGDLKLSHVSFKHFKTKPDQKVKIFNSDVYTTLGQTDYNTLMETGTEATELTEINTYLTGDSMYDFNTAFTNFTTGTLNDVVAKELHYTQFNYTLQLSMHGDKNLDKALSWSFDLNGLDTKIRNHLESVVEEFRTYYFTSPESPLQNEINIRLASINKNITMLTKFDSLITKINTNQIPFPSLKVIRPIAPRGFKVLGDIVLTSAKGILQRQAPTTTTAATRDALGASISDITSTTTPTTIARYQSDHRDGAVHEKDYIHYQLQKYVAVPETCVKTVREWRDTDKVFEINESGKTLQIYNNPYTNTITVTTNKQKPKGNVEKMIACVKECDVVSELKKTDECAKKLYKTKKSLEGGSSVTPDLANAEENKYYLNKIQSRAEHIKNLTSAARDLQIQQDKYEIINAERNRNKLQRYVDDQGRNIAILRDKLEKGKNTIDLNAYIHPDAKLMNDGTGGTMQVGSRQETTNMINKLIGQSSLPEKAKDGLLTKVENYKRQLDNELISPDEYNTRVNDALQSCPEYNLNGLIHKDTVGQVCYGCDI